MSNNIEKIDKKVLHFCEVYSIIPQGKGDSGLIAVYNPFFGDVVEGYSINQNLKEEDKRYGHTS